MRTIEKCKYRTTILGIFFVVEVFDSTDNHIILKRTLDLTTFGRKADFITQVWTEAKQLLLKQA